jgi:pilus assembly protein CpaE
MRDDSGQNLTILMPEASICFFSVNPKTLELSNELKKDWRFARVHINCHKGDIHDATSYYIQNPSPDLLIIETDHIDDSFLQHLETLASHCDENTQAIVIGSTNDVALYRRLIAMGISDYLVNPLSIEHLSENLAKALINRMGIAQSQLIAFVGAKGGVGVSTLSALTASLLANSADRKTILLDACGAKSSLSMTMGFDPVTSLAEATKIAQSNNPDAFARLIHKKTEKLSILSSGNEAILDCPATLTDYENMINLLLQSWPYVVVDLSGAESEITKRILGRATHIFVVTSPILSSLRQCRTLLQELRTLKGGNSNIHLLMNQQGQYPKQEVNAKDIATALEQDAFCIIAHDAKVFIEQEHELFEKSQKTNIQQMMSVILDSLIPQTLSNHETQEKSVSKTMWRFFKK